MNVIPILRPVFHNPLTPYRIGVVTALNTDAGTARVQFAERDQLISYWLTVIQHGTHTAKGWWFPQVGDMVNCLMDENDEDGSIVGAIYSSSDLTPGWTAPSALKLTSDFGGSVSSTPLTGTYDQMFQQAAATCPAIQNYGNPPGQGWKLLKALATTESSLNPSAVSEPAADGSRSWGMMQINTSAHPGYSTQQLINQPELNIRIGTADLCGKLAKYGDVSDALAHYKGWQGYSDPSHGGAAAIQVNKVYAEYAALGGT